MIVRQKRIWILRAAHESIHAIMKMMRCPNRIAGITDIPKNTSLLHDGAGFNISESVEMGIVVPLPPRTQDTNHKTTKVVFPDLEYDTPGCA
jgi:hypothetical protein